MVRRDMIGPFPHVHQITFNAPIGAKWCDLITGGRTNETVRVERDLMVHAIAGTPGEPVRREVTSGMRSPLQNDDDVFQCTIE